MEENMKLSVIMDLLNKEIAKLNSEIAETNNPDLNGKLDYLLNLKNSIYSGNIDEIDEFLKRYKENSL